jgi:nucleoside-diphosphate-sugar epimerase
MSEHDNRKLIPKRTTLITGASGFVGSHLMAEMARRRLPTCGVSRGAAPGLITVPSYGPETNWGPALKDVDTVVHLAARVHVMRETAAEPLAQFRLANTVATINLARQAAASGVRRLVFVSTIKVNGERTEPGEAFTEMDAPDPQDPYAISKAEAEEALVELSHQTGMSVTIIRPPLVYGPGVGGNFSTLMRWAASDFPSIFSAVSNKRSFIHVGNLCDLLITALDHPNAANRTFLASDGHDLSTHELIMHLKLAKGRRQLSVPIPRIVLSGIGAMLGRSDAVQRLTGNLQVNIEATRKGLDWHPQRTIADAWRI